jgi:O-succinylbenzoic acid--CoA ligase
VTSRPLQAVLLPPSESGRLLAALAAALDGSGPAILPLDPALPEASLARTIETLAPSSLLTMTGTSALGAGPTGPSAPGVADDTAVVIATSGSTGVPKGVELSAAALTASAAASLRRIGAQPGERWLCCLPTFHISGLGVLVRSLISGTDPVIGAKADPDVLAASGCAHVSLVPTQLRRLLDAGAKPAGFRTVLLGGAAAAGDLLPAAAAAGWPVVTTYGMSETCGGCVYDGRPLDGVDAVPGADGRIEITGPVLFSGYRLQPELTAVALAGGRFRTADLGHFRADGRLVIRGRADDVINTGGEKVVAGEVEAALGTSPGVADVVVIGVPDAEWGELVTAFVVPADPAEPPDLGQLRSIVRQTLSPRAAPRKVFVMPVFPLLPSGKPDRAALRQVAQRDQDHIGPGGQWPDIGAQ